MNALMPVNQSIAKAVPATAPDDEQFLTFHCAGNLYGISILQIKEIIQFGMVTDVPMVPPEIRGVVNLRGAVLPVIDLAVRFGRRSAEVGRRTCIVVLELSKDGKTRDIGMMVDSVSEVLEIPGDLIEPAPAFGSAVRTDFIRGMGKVGGNFVILLDADRVFSIDELQAIPPATPAELPLLSATVE